jgi:hypothetical protein
MGKLYLITGFVFVLAFTSSAQNTEVSDWVASHPSVNFINENKLHHFSADDLALMDGKYIVFQGEITEKDIVAFDPSYLDKKDHNGPDEISVNTKFDKATYVKIWQANNPSVKIVKRSDYNMSDPSTQLEYVNRGCLILIGDVVTKEDIDLYHP